jgi:predicted metalloprotease with PDZ domain
MNTPSADLNLPPMDIPALVGFLAHEMLHQFPEELSDVGKGEPTYWWSEGVATFYAATLTFRLGVKTPEQFVSDWNRFLGNYYSDPNRLLSYKEITGGMFGSVGLNLMYGKGHAFMMLLNYRIRQRSGGTRSLDDLIFPLVRQHRRGGSYTREDFLAALDRQLGPDGRALYEEFRAGGKLLDLPTDVMGPCFRRETVEYRPFALGFDAGAATAGDQRSIRNLIKGSAAERAGVREGDDVIGNLQLNAARADTSAALTLELRRNGTPVTVTFVPRLGPLQGYRWAYDPAVPTSACKL